MTSFPIGEDVELGYLHGTSTDIPPNSLLTALQVGRYGPPDDNWLRIWYATLDVDRFHNFDLGPQLTLPSITARLRTPRFKPGRHFSPL